jgi:O-antigen/teichoic acid export membrane protein
MSLFLLKVRGSMNYTRSRNLFRALFIISVFALILYSVFFLPDDFLGSEPPIAPTMVKFSFCPVFIFLGAVLLPILSAIGWVATTLLKNQQEKDRIDIEEHDDS